MEMLRRSMQYSEKLLLLPHPSVFYCFVRYYIIFLEDTKVVQIHYLKAFIDHSRKFKIFHFLPIMSEKRNDSGRCFIIIRQVRK